MTRRGPSDTQTSTGRPALGRRALLRGLPAAVTVLPLTGCGFQPVYMPSASGTPGPAQRDLAAVFVPLLPDRPGQVLRQALQQRFANDSGTRHRYELLVSFWISGEGLAVLPDTSVTRLRLTGYANWSLWSYGPPRTKQTEGFARALDGSNILEAQYFALDLENDAVGRRIADRLADQITSQVAIFFRNNAAKTVAG